jgi:hypothetical protein
MPPPVPPRVKAGRTIAGQPDLGQGAASAEAAPLGVGGAIDDRRGRVRLADPVEQVAEALAILGHLDRLERRADQRTPVRSRTPALRSRATARFRAVWPPSPARRPSGRSRAIHRLHRDLDRERLEVDDVGDAGVGHDRGRVRVDQDRPDALGPQRPAGLGAGIVELGRLADDDRPRTEDEDRAPARPADHVGSSFTQSPRRAPPGPMAAATCDEAVEDRQRVERPRRALGVVLDRLDRQLRRGAGPRPSRR